MRFRHSPFVPLFGPSVLVGVVSLFFAPIGQCAGDSSAAEEVKLLTIGNSFSGDSTSFLPDIVKAGGKKMLMFNANIGGNTLAQHVKSAQVFDADSTDPNGRPYKKKNDPKGGEKRNFSLQEALASVPWDCVTIQQSSSKSCNPVSFEPFTETLVGYIRKYAPTAKILLLQTWAYREDHPWLAKQKISQQQMFEGIRSTYAGVAARHHLQILPAGEAIQAARALPQWTFAPDPKFDYANPKFGTLPAETGSLNMGWSWKNKEKDGATELNLDAKHLNNPGKFLTACVLYEFFFSDVRENSFVPPDVPSEDAAELRRVAQESVAKHVAANQTATLGP